MNKVLIFSESEEKGRLKMLELVENTNETVTWMRKDSAKTDDNLFKIVTHHGLSARGVRCNELWFDKKLSVEILQEVALTTLRPNVDRVKDDWNFNNYVNYF